MGARRRSPVSPVQIGEHRVEPGEAQRLDLSMARLPTHEVLNLSVKVVNGIRSGPRLWLSAAIHGDELNGVEIIRRVLDVLDPAALRGSVIAVPILNVYGFLHQSRYLPDRRDLNRHFPGSRRGSLASQLAYFFMKEIVENCTHGIDLHTAAQPRSNLPQIRADLDDPETLRCARAFRTPVILHSRTRDGSLREAATRKGIAVLLFEGGEPLRFSEKVIQTGVRGVIGVLRELGMIAKTPKGLRPRGESLEVRKSAWVRARVGGILRLDVDHSTRVVARQRLGVIGDAFGEGAVLVRAPFDGIVIGRTQNPLVYRGDGIVQLARLPRAGTEATNEGGSQ